MVSLISFLNNIPLRIIDSFVNNFVIINTIIFIVLLIKKIFVSVSTVSNIIILRRKFSSRRFFCPEIAQDAQSSQASLQSRWCLA